MYIKIKPITLFLALVFMAAISSSVWAGGMIQQQVQQKTKMNLRTCLGPQHYPAFDVDISQDVFVNPEVFKKLTGGMPFIDENGDGICDIAQDSQLFKDLNIGPCEDKNGDTICDCFETRDAYKWLGMKNFVDVDGDGLCDNYEQDPLAK